MKFAMNAENARKMSMRSQSQASQTWQICQKCAKNVSGPREIRRIIHFSSFKNREGVPPLEDGPETRKSTMFFATFETSSNCTQTHCTYGSIGDLRWFGRKDAKCSQTITTPGSIANFAKCIFDVKKCTLVDGAHNVP